MPKNSAPPPYSAPPAPVDTGSINKLPVSEFLSRIDMRYLIKALLKYSASDLHIKSGRPPLYRINGKLIPAKMPELTTEKVEQLLRGVLSTRQLDELSVKKQVDISFHISELGRFRCNVYYQRGALSGAIRIIPFTVPSLEELGVPDGVIKDFTQHKTGLVLITGATGSGKSTTLASMVQYMNQTSQYHILTLEDPIEFVYRDQKSAITQREVGSDMLSIRDGLVAGLRQDPDVIVVGEMRDAATIQIALTAAETGHLVIATLHTNDAKSTITRILDVFEPEGRNQIRTQLGASLVGVVTQRLIARADGSGRVPACEVLVKSPAIEGYILRNELDRIQDAMGTSNAYYKMQTMNQALEKLVNNKMITQEEALKWSPNPDDLKLKFAGLNHGEGY